MNKDEEKVLRDRIITPEDYSEAVDILLELKDTDREFAEELALEVIGKTDEDPYYQASAFNIFYLINPLRALEMIRVRLAEVNLIMLSSMIECVTEDIAILEGNESLLATVKAIDKRTETLDKNEFEIIKETIDDFKETFEKVLSRHHK